MSVPAVSAATPLTKPHNILHTISDGINSVVSLPAKGLDMLSEGIASATNFISAALPCFPAATLGSMALGAPHAHPLHPPSGPLPIPPTPIPPFGTIMFGNCVQVLINGKPAARCGDLGLSPTCCGIPPVFEIFMGSSKVFIGGARAARMGDMTYHCKPVATPRGAAAALKKAADALVIAGMVGQAIGAVGDGVEAVRADDSAMAGALALSAGMTAAQIANDVIALAMGAAMGKDLCVPPGTPGAILDGSPNVLIGGFPLPSTMDIAMGALKLVKGLRSRQKRGSGRSSCGCG